MRLCAVLGVEGLWFDKINIYGFKWTPGASCAYFGDFLEMGLCWGHPITRPHMGARNMAPDLIYQMPVDVIQSLSCVWLFAIPWTTACQASLSFTISELAQIHVHWVSDAIQLSHPLLPPSPALNLSQHQGLFPLHQVAKLLELQLQHESCQWIFRIDWFDLLAIQGTLKCLVCAIN